jgi:F-type H+-transporting ATPase subunit b
MSNLTVPLRRIAALAAVMLCMPAVAMANGMPQLDFSTPLPVALMVWGVLIFAVLYGLMSRWALPRVAEVLELRAAKIGQDLDAANAAKAASDAAIAELTEATRTAQATAQAQVAGAVATAKEAAAAQAAVLNAKLEAQLASAERQIAQARTAAFGALRQVATETATVVVNRLTGGAPATQTVDTAVGAVLTARGQA